LINRSHGKNSVPFNGYGLGDVNPTHGNDLAVQECHIGFQ
jgi:hypothetical protein